MKTADLTQPSHDLRNGVLAVLVSQTVLLGVDALLVAPAQPLIRVQEIGLAVSVWVTMLALFGLGVESIVSGVRNLK